MMKNILRLFLLFIITIFFLTSCYEFSLVDQPDLADPNSSFDVPITVILTPEDEGGRGYFGILLPIGWTAQDSISYGGVHSGTFIYSSIASNSMDSLSNAPVGYYWWVCQGDSVDSLLDGTVSLTPQINTDNQSGTFFIDYMIADRFETDRYHSYVVRNLNYPISVNAPITATVTNTNDSGQGSLRQALAEVSSSGEILFNLSYPATIVLDSQLVIDRSLTITGPDSGELTISGNDTTNTFRILSHSNVKMSNLKISNGNAWLGGGIYMGYASQGVVNSGIILKLTNVTICNNSANEGGGIWCGGETLILTNVTICNNSAETGGGIALVGTDLNLTNVTIRNNSAGIGGGIYCLESDFNLITNMTISDNSAVVGGGIWGGDSTTIVINTILWNNSPDQVDGSSVNIFYSDVMGGWSGVGNIDVDPMFVDTANGDYRLQAGSACIDAGTAFFEVGGDTLINLNPWQYNGSAPDMGAYEFGPPLGITEEQNSPKVYTLKQNYPNPFNPITNIEFSIPKTEFVTLKIYNIIGQEVAILVEDKLTTGTYKQTWDATGFASGLYFYILVTDKGIVQTKKLILLK